MSDEAATLRDVARRYLEELAEADRASAPEVERFVRWAGADRAIGALRGQDVANYAETFTGSMRDVSARADAVRKFLAYAKKAGYTSTNLGTHLRVRKTSNARPAGGGYQEVHVSAEEHSALQAELAELKAQRPQIVRDIQRAMADKDFRENAPLDAAKQQQAYIEGRIRTIEAKLGNAVVVEAGASQGDVVEIGTTVLLRNLDSGAETRYTLVRPGEVSPSEGRISFESPVGRALLQRREGDEVEVATPSGRHRFRIERIET